MTAIEPEGPPAPEDHAYFLAIERIFLDFRKKAALLSAADWQEAQGWHRQGIPVELIRDVMQKLFERQQSRKGRTISGLRYFRAAVESAWEEMLAQKAGGRPEVGEALAVPTRLVNLASRLPESLPERARFVAALSSLSGPPDEVEASLRTLDADLLTVLRGALESGERTALATQSEQALAMLRGRLAMKDLEVARIRLAEQVLRRRFEVPVLSLFSPEARGEAPETGS